MAAEIEVAAQARGCIFGGMAEPGPKISFKPQPVKVGLDWQVVAVHASGQREHITGFKSETEALDWIRSPQCHGWLIARGYTE